MTDISLAQARAIIAAALAGAAERGLAAASIVITDGNGAIRSADRTDAAPPYGVAIATAKARTALGFRRSTVKTAAVFGDKPALVTGLNAAVGGEFLPLGGGVVVIGVDGVAIGAAGLAGGAPDMDHLVIAEAVAAAGLAILE